MCCVPQVEVSPLENAIQVVENKNQELRSLIGQYQHKQAHGNVSLLSMCLNGVIDAAVNGGIARYQEVSSPTGQPNWEGILSSSSGHSRHSHCPGQPSQVSLPWLCRSCLRMALEELPCSLVLWHSSGVGLLFSELCHMGNLADYERMLSGLQEEPWSPVLHKK